MDGDPLPLPVVSIGHRGDCVDGDTLARAQAGEVDAFRQLIRTHQGAVYSLAARLVGIREDAQELTQDVFLQLHRNLASIESPSHLRFWLRKTACHRSIDRLRKQTREPSTSLEAAVEQEARGQGRDPLLERRLRELVAELPPMPRAVVLLRYQEDLDPSDIALVLELPLNTVKSHLKRSLALLRSRCDGLDVE